MLEKSFRFGEKILWGETSTQSAKVGKFSIPLFHRSLLQGRQESNITKLTLDSHSAMLDDNRIMNYDNNISLLVGGIEKVLLLGFLMVFLVQWSGNVAYSSSSIVHWQGDLQMLLENSNENLWPMEKFVAIMRHAMVFDALSSKVEVTFEFFLYEMKFLLFTINIYNVTRIWLCHKRDFHETNSTFTDNIFHSC